MTQTTRPDGLETLVKTPPACAIDSCLVCSAAVDFVEPLGWSGRAVARPWGHGLAVTRWLDRVELGAAR